MKLLGLIYIIITKFTNIILKLYLINYKFEKYLQKM